MDVMQLEQMIGGRVRVIYSDSKIYLGLLQSVRDGQIRLENCIEYSPISHGIDLMYQRQQYRLETTLLIRYILHIDTVLTEEFCVAFQKYVEMGISAQQRNMASGAYSRTSDFPQTTLSRNISERLPSVIPYLPNLNCPPHLQQVRGQTSSWNGSIQPEYIQPSPAESVQNNQVNEYMRPYLNNLRYVAALNGFTSINSNVLPVNFSRIGISPLSQIWRIPVAFRSVNQSHQLDNRGLINDSSMIQVNRFPNSNGEINRNYFNESTNNIDVQRSTLPHNSQAERSMMCAFTQPDVSSPVENCIPPIFNNPAPPSSIPTVRAPTVTENVMNPLQGLEGNIHIGSYAIPTLNRRTPVTVSNANVDNTFPNIRLARESRNNPNTGSSYENLNLDNSDNSAHSKR